MMQAAQLAAEAAMQEAAARDAAAAAAAAGSHHSAGYHHHQQRQQHPESLPEHHQQYHLQHQHQHQLYHPHMTMENGMDVPSASLPMDDEQMGLLRALQAADISIHDSINMMGLDPNDASSIQALLQVLAQREEEILRPGEHYLTIAQNGKCC